MWAEVGARVRAYGEADIVRICTMPARLAHAPLAEIRVRKAERADLADAPVELGGQESLREQEVGHLEQLVGDASRSGFRSTSGRSPAASLIHRHGSQRQPQSRTRHRGPGG